MPAFPDGTAPDPLHALQQQRGGLTLRQWMESHGPAAPVQAVEWTIDLLEALRLMHQRGSVCGVISLDTVAVNPDGRIELPAPSPSGAIPVSAKPATDLAGAARLLQAMVAPDAMDDALRAMVQRSFSSDAAARYTGAAEFRDALTLWLQTSQLAEPLSAAGTSALNTLLSRMRHHSDFPAMSDSIVRIQGMADSDKESVGSVTNEILKDVALTNKLLRLVNSAHFGRGGNISTVSRAVALVGFNGIRNMALSLVLLEHMQDKGHAAQLREEFLRSLMAGSIAGALGGGPRDSEEAFIGAMFQNLGRLLMQFYFPREALQVRDLMQSAPAGAMTEASASLRVLGLSVEDLGLGVAKAWGLPLSIQRCMRRPQGAPPALPRLASVQHGQWVSAAANDLADALSRGSDQDLAQRLERVARHYAPALGLGVRDVLSATKSARLKLIELAGAMDLQVASTSPAARLLHSPDHDAPAPGGADGEAESGLQSLELQAALRAQGGPPQTDDSARRHAHVAEILTAGIQDVTNAMVEDVKLSDLLRMILETMLRALEFDRIIFCMREAKTDVIQGRFGLGQGVEKHVPVFKISPKAATPDLFAVVCLKGADTMIADASEPRVAQRLPGWYLHTLNAPTFLLLPLQIKGAPFGLIYADKLQSGALDLDDKELSLLRTLRNQAVMAFKQAT